MKRTILLVVVASVAIFCAWKAIQYASPPTSEKDCTFTWPEVSEPKKGDLTINDASCLNKTSVFRIIQIRSADDIKNALAFAKANNLKVTSAGQRHSLGGQSFVQNGLVLDMRNFKGMVLNKEAMTINVQAGATWREVQKFLDAEGLSVKAMQSINIFTVGGTLSVNAHGIAHGPAQVAPTVKQMRIMKSDGEILTASPTQNTELFRHVLGGYGLFGIILDADLEVVANEAYLWKTKFIDYKDFPEIYGRLKSSKITPLLYGRISVSPSSYLTETELHTFERTSWNHSIPALQEPKLTWFTRLVFNLSKTSGLGRWLRWKLETYLEPKIHPCISRELTEDQDGVCFVSRNQEMYDSMDYLRNRLATTDILQEYFIPENRMVAFVDGLRNVVKSNGANLINVTVRVVEKDTITALPYAKGDRLAFVLYFDQGLNIDDSKVVQKTTTDLIDLASGLGGTFYLPYQLYYSKSQLRKAYPEIDSFFATKKRYDPTEMLTNTWYQKYANQ